MLHSATGFQKDGRSPILCPVKTFLDYRERRPQCSTTGLFINSSSPNKPLTASTIQGWIFRLLRKSTSETRISIRLIASSLALSSGIPKEDVVTMGNWTNSSTFENHYRREHLSLFDFTNTLITLDKQSYDLFCIRVSHSILEEFHSSLEFLY
ncbi:hypothetical protein G6F44_013031 [Rhizopus delemar]|nr:hypothetical protein G6F44_013031 [Rhizopus delemar]